MRLPAGVEPLSLHEGARTELELAVSPDAADVLSDARDAPADETGWHLTPVWLSPADSVGTLEVLIGDRPIGHVGVSQAMWEELGQEAEEGRFVAGELGVRGTATGDVEVSHVQCTLPDVEE